MLSAAGGWIATGHWITAGSTLAEPLEPDRDLARRWLQEELARREYRVGGDTLLGRLLRWFFQLFDSVPAVGMPRWQLIFGGLAIVAVVIVVARWIAGPVRLNRGRGRAASGLLADEHRSATELRAAADAAAEMGDFSLAVAERFRAIVRALMDRGLLMDAPGLTAREAAGAVATALPSLRRALLDSAKRFDQVVYGGFQATSEQYQAVVALDSAVTELVGPGGRAAISQELLQLTGVSR